MAKQIHLEGQGCSLLLITWISEAALLPVPAGPFPGILWLLIVFQDTSFCVQLSTVYLCRWRPKSHK